MRRIHLIPRFLAIIFVLAGATGMVSDKAVSHIYLTNKAPGYAHKETNNFFRFLQTKAKEENIFIGSDFPSNCTGYWDDYTEAAYLAYPDREYYYGRCEIALEFFGHRQIGEIAVVSRSHDDMEQFENLRKIGALAMIYLDRNIAYGDALAFIDRLRRDQPPERESLGELRAYLVVDDGDADMILLDIKYGGDRLQAWPQK